MGLLLQALNRLWPDPRPTLAFEIGEGVLVAIRCQGSQVLARAECKLPAPAPADPPAQPPEGLPDAIQAVLGELRPVTSPQVAVLLPDAVTRLALLEFETLPRKAQDLRQAVEDRFRSSLPFDLELARIAFRIQSGGNRPAVLAAGVASQYLLPCEEAFGAAALYPGYVGSSCAAALNLVREPAMAVLLKCSGQIMTIAAVESTRVRLVRHIALPQDQAADAASSIREVLADVFPTLVYIEENLGHRVARLLVTGFGELQSALLAALSQELGIPVAQLLPDESASASCGAGLMGYIHA